MNRHRTHTCSQAELSMQLAFRQSAFSIWTDRHACMHACVAADERTLARAVQKGAPYHASLCACCYVSMVCSHCSRRHSIALHCFHLQRSSNCAASLIVATPPWRALRHHAYHKKTDDTQDEQSRRCHLASGRGTLLFVQLRSVPCTLTCRRTGALDICLNTCTGMCCPTRKACRKTGPMTSTSPVWV
jgi:hypothetical protein